jgi:hypothetical protein
MKKSLFTAAGLSMLALAGCLTESEEEATGVLEAEVTRGPAEKVLDGYHIFSPNLQLEPPCALGQCGPNNKLYMFYSGFSNTAQAQYDSAIYRALCPVVPTSSGVCSSSIKVLDPPAEALRGVSDPSLVRLGSGDRAYYIMYMTCQATDGRSDICYSTSWASDLGGWSPPTRMLRRCFQPSATVVSGSVRLWCTGQGSNSGIRFYDLGPSGTVVHGPEALGTLVETDKGFSVNWSNVDVMFRPGYGYQILAEKRCPNLSVCKNQIDYFWSLNGTRWQIGVEAVVVPSQQTVATPAPHPHSHGVVYYSQSPANALSDIYVSQWR